MFTVAPELRPSHLERLAMCKYMVGVASEQLQQPDPQASIALLTYHDGVELFLVTAADYLGIATDRDTTFLKYWKALRPGDRDLPFYGAMKRLNDGRVALKHHGHIPRRADLAEFAVVVPEFYAEAVSAVFVGLNWADVSMADYVTVPAVRDALKRAERSLSEGKVADGLSACAEAFDDLLVAVGESARSEYGYRSPFDLGEDMSWKTASSVGLQRVIGPTAKLADFVDATSKSIQAIQRGLKIVLLGLDYKRYARFMQLTPIIVKYFGGHRELHPRHEKGPQAADDLQFCIEFVLDAALALRAVTRLPEESSPSTSE
jgi:hypothetical protein